MADLAQLDLRARGGEARIRALLEDIADFLGRKESAVGFEMALVVWFGKSPDASEHNLLALFKGRVAGGIHHFDRVPLRWLSGANEPPFVNIYTASVNYFTEQLDSNAAGVAPYFKDNEFEVLRFNKQLLTPSVLRAFNVITEPSGLVKGWYLSLDEFKSQAPRSLLAARARTRPEVGILKTWESPDFEFCRALIQVKVGQRWIPPSAEGITAYSFYSDWEWGKPGYFLAEGGAVYRIIKFEAKTIRDAPVLEKPRDDRYPELYLQTVHPPEQSAA